MDAIATPRLARSPVLDAEAWPDTQPAMYRSEGFAEDLDLSPSPAQGFDPCVADPNAD